MIKDVRFESTGFFISQIVKKRTEVKFEIKKQICLSKSKRILRKQRESFIHTP